MIWHLLPLPRWQSAGDGPYVPGTEDTAGQDTAPFVHASPDEPTLLAVANDRFSRPHHGGDGKPRQSGE